MFNSVIKKYITNMTISDMNNFLVKNNIYLDSDELSFSYNYIKNNYEDILSNHGVIHLSSFKDKFKPDNYIMISDLYHYYYTKYYKYL